MELETSIGIFRGTAKEINEIIEPRIKQQKRKDVVKTRKKRGKK